MKVKRAIKSGINLFLCYINVILWIFNIATLGELVTGIKVCKNRKERLIYGICSMIQYLTYPILGLGYCITLCWWIKNELSLAERMSGFQQTNYLFP